MAVGMSSSCRYELLHRENQSLVVGQGRLEEGENLLIGMGSVNVAAPDPTGAVAPVQAQQRGRLRIVHDDIVVMLLQEVSDSLVLGQIDVLDLGGEVEGGASEGVVEPLRHLEKLRTSWNHQLVGVDSQRPVQGHQGAEQLGYAAAVGRGVDVGHPPAAVKGCQLLQLSQLFITDDGSVAVQRLRRYVYAMKHVPPRC